LGKLALQASKDKLLQLVQLDKLDKLVLSEKQAQEDKQAPLDLDLAVPLAPLVKPVLLVLLALQVLELLALLGQLALELQVQPAPKVKLDQLAQPVLG
jgi:hypothetical protein